MARTRDGRDPAFDGGLGARFSPAAFDGQPFTYHAPTAGAAPASADPFGMFDDPSTQYLTNLIHKQIDQFSQPATPDAATTDVMSALRGLMGGGAGPAGNPLLGDFITQGRQRISELNQEPFSAQEENALRTKTKDQLTVDRDAQRQTALEDMSRRGIADSSGVLQDRYKSIDAAYTSADAKAANDLMLWIAGQRQDRKNQATSIAQTLAGLGEQEASRADSVNASRSGQILQAATTLANIAAQQRGETRANQQQVLNLAAMLAQLPVDRLNMAMGVLNGMGGGAAGVNSAFGNTLALSNQQQQQNYINSQGNAAFINALTQMASYWANRPQQKKPGQL